MFNFLIRYFHCILSSLLALLMYGTPTQAAKLKDPIWDSICGFGKDKSQGCDAVRDREIVDATQYPWSAIGRINFAGYRTKQHCTGALISERLVLTAAHCLYNKYNKRWLKANSLHFVAGFQNDNITMHSIAVSYTVSKVQNPLSKVFQNSPREDWAIIKLRDPIGASVGYLGWDVLNDVHLSKAQRQGAKITFAGYPGIRKYAMSVDRDCGEARILRNNSLLFHSCSVMQGDSGGPILLLEKDKITMIGINVGGIVSKGKIEFVSAPLSVLYNFILENLDGNSLVKDRSSRFGLSGWSPSK